MKPEDRLGMGGCVDHVEWFFVGAPLVGADEVDAAFDAQLLFSVVDEAILALLKWRFFFFLQSVQTWNCHKTTCINCLFLCCT